MMIFEKASILMDLGSVRPAVVQINSRYNIWWFYLYKVKMFVRTIGIILITFLHVLSLIYRKEALAMQELAAQDCTAAFRY